MHTTALDFALVSFASYITWEIATACLVKRRYRRSMSVSEPPTSRCPDDRNLIKDGDQPAIH